MKKITALCIIFIMTSIFAKAQTSAPIPSCACNNIASQINSGKSVDTQIQKEIEKMDKEAANLDNQKTSRTNHQKHKWFWQR